MAKQSTVKSKRKLVNPMFHLQTKQEDDKQLSTGMIKIVRRTGQLNLSGRSLTNVPSTIFTMYELNDDDRNIHMDFNNRKDEDENWWNFKPLTYLDLSSNVLLEIPGEIGMFEDLSVINLQDNNLTTLPPEFGKLTRLTKLNLSYNKITHLPAKFYNLTDLQILNLSHNCLDKLDKDFPNLIMLQQLDLSYNRLTELPPGLGFLIRLTEINLSNNKLTELPPDIVNLRVLFKLDVTNNELTTLPKMSELKKLQFLYAQHNNIEQLPDFEDCNNLQQIYFGNNYIKEVTVEFCGKMPHLKILDLRDNKIEKLPNEIAMLQHLIRLDLTNNELTTLPNSLCLLGHLQNLQIEGNKLKQIRSDIIKSGTIRILKHLREKFDGEEMENLQKSPTKRESYENRIFPDKHMMKNSQSLVVVMKQLTHVPDQVFQDAENAKVTIVDLSKNKLNQIPPGLELLVNDLTELNLSMNCLNEIPDFIADCCKLKYLNLSNNSLITLPESLETLITLRELVLSNNKFPAIPQCIYKMIGLEILLISDNKITELDIDGLKNLKCLATLDLSNNNINHIPPELGNMKQIRSLELKGNCFRQPRYAILEQGTKAILSYLRDRIPQ